MKKSDIKLGMKEISEAISSCLKSVEETLKPYNEIKKHLDYIQDIQDNAEIDIKLDFEEVAVNTLKSCINYNLELQEIKESIDRLVADLEEWKYEVSESKQEQIQEYIDSVNSIWDEFDIDSIECKEDFGDQLDNMKTVLNDIEL